MTSPRPGVCGRSRSRRPRARRRLRPQATGRSDLPGRSGRHPRPNIAQDSGAWSEWRSADRRVPSLHPPALARRSAWTGRTSLRLVDRDPLPGNVPVTGATCLVGIVQAGSPGHSRCESGVPGTDHRVVGPDDRRARRHEDVEGPRRVATRQLMPHPLPADAIRSGARLPPRPPHSRCNGPTTGRPLHPIPASRGRTRGRANSRSLGRTLHSWIPSQLLHPGRRSSPSGRHLMVRGERRVGRPKFTLQRTWPGPTMPTGRSR